MTPIRAKPEKSGDAKPRILAAWQTDGRVAEVNRDFFRPDLPGRNEMCFLRLSLGASFLLNLGDETMQNSKEVVILIIMIFVVLVSAAKASDDSPATVTESVMDNTGIEYFELDKDAGFAISVGGETDIESSLELGVVSTSSLSNLEDDYGFVVTLTTVF